MPQKFQKNTDHLETEDTLKIFENTYIRRMHDRALDQAALDDLKGLKKTVSTLGQSFDIHLHDDILIRTACNENSLSVVKYLMSSPDLSEHANISANKNEAIFSVCRIGHEEMMGFLLKNKNSKKQVWDCVLSGGMEILLSHYHEGMFVKFLFDKKFTLPKDKILSLLNQTFFQKYPEGFSLVFASCAMSVFSLKEKSKILTEFLSGTENDHFITIAFLSCPEDLRRETAKLFLKHKQKTANILLSQYVNKAELERNVSKAAKAKPKVLKKRSL